MSANNFHETLPIEIPKHTAIGRPPFTPQFEDRRVVKKMASFGIPQPEISKFLRISAPTLRKYFRAELDVARAEANTRVLSSLFTQATSRRSVRAAIFWAKTRCGFKSNALPSAQEFAAMLAAQQLDEEPLTPEIATSEAAPTATESTNNEVSPL